MDNLLGQQLKAHLSVEADRRRRRLKVNGQTGLLAQVNAPLDNEGPGLAALVSGVNGNDMTV